MISKKFLGRLQLYNKKGLETQGFHKWKFGSHLLLIFPCYFKKLKFFLLSLYTVTSNFCDFAVSDFQILKLRGSPETLKAR